MPTVPVKEKIEAVTGGSIEIILAGPGEIVPTSDLISAVVAGDQIQGAFCAGTVTSFTWDEMYAQSFPFGFEADEYNSWLYEGGGIALQNKKLADEGLVAFPVVPTKQCGSIISISYILWLLAVRGETSGVYKARQGSISKPALLCRDYPMIESYSFTGIGVNAMNVLSQ